MFIRARVIEFVSGVGLFTFAVAGGYIILSLFEAWAFLPFWVQDIALAAVLVAIYVFTRKWARKARLFAPRPRRVAAPAQRGNLRPLAALAGIAAIGLAAGFLYAGDAAKGRIFQSLTLNLRQPPAEVALSIAATPPEYTGLPEILLYEGIIGAARHVEEAEEKILPQGTVLEVRFEKTGAYSPLVLFAGKKVPLESEGSGQHLATIPVFEAGVLDITVGPYVSARQAISIIPDAAPRVVVIEKPRLTTRKSLKIRADFSDDHGIAEAYLELSRRGLTRTESQTIPLPLVPGPGGEGEKTFFINLLENPWAGTTASATLVVVDELGQRSAGEGVIIALPERAFSDPDAAALISIRRALINNPERKNAQVRRLDIAARQLSAGKANFGLYTALRTAYWKLRSAETQDDIDEISRILWRAALDLEGSGAAEEQEIHTLFSDLAQAIRADGDRAEVSRLAHRLEGKLAFLFDKEFQMFSRRTGMAESLNGVDIPALDRFKDLIARVEILAESGENAEALAAILQLQGYFETVAVEPERLGSS